VTPTCATWQAAPARGSFFIIATTTAEGALIYDRLEQAVDWADAQDRAGAEVFVGMNPREREAKRPSPP
jgi:hypothetical protein